MQSYRAGLSALLSFLSFDFFEKNKAYKNCQYCIVASIYGDMREIDLDIQKPPRTNFLVFRLIFEVNSHYVCIKYEFKAVSPHFILKLNMSVDTSCMKTYKSTFRSSFYYV